MANDLLEIGRQGLNTHRQALSTTSNNIANASNPNHSRQRVVLEAGERELSGSRRIGGGVEVSKIIRVHDHFIGDQIVGEAKNLGSLRIKSDTLGRMESFLHPNEGNIGESLNKFFGDIRELSVNPHLATTSEMVKESGAALSAQFRGMSDSLHGLQRELDTRMENTAQEVNAMAQDLATLNERIVRAGHLRQEPLEMLDRRDALLKQLSEKVGFDAAEDHQGNINIILGGAGVLVHGSHANTLIASPTEARQGKAVGANDLFLKDHTGAHLATHAITDGELSAMVHMRDKVIDPTLDRLDHIAFELSRNVNDIHKQGVGRDGVGGRAFFKEMENVKGAASQMALSPEIEMNHESIAAGYSASPGDNRIAVELSRMQTQSLLPDFNSMGPNPELRHTFNESINAFVGDIGIETQSHERNLSEQKAMMEQLENYRQSISGVSMDEEAIHMIQFQTAFNAAAKTVKLGDELLQTILSLKE